MKPSDELFKLIKSLSKSEKRFFKLSSSLQSGEKNYIKLFDAIEKQEEYDEAAIKDQFKKETFIKHLPSEKNHLYKLILKSLRGFHADNSVGSQLAEEIKNIELLHEKALYSECTKIIKKAKRLAYKHEKFYYLFELIRWEKMLLEEEFLSGNFDKDLNLLIKEEHDVIEKLRNLAEYMILYSKINYVFRKGGYARNDEEKDIVNEISDYHLIKGKNTALSRRAAATCYYIQGLCAVVKYDYAKSFEKFNRVVKIFEENPVLIQDIPKQYIKSLNNLLFCYIDYGDYKGFFDLINKMRALRDQPGFSSTDIQLKIFTSTYNAELIAYDKMGEYEKGIAIIDQVLEGIENYGEKLNKEEVLLFYYSISYTYFGAGEYRQALKWINQVLNDNETGLRQDVYSFSRIFNLIIHYELENFELLDYLLKAALRFYVKRKKDSNREYKFETTFLKYFKRLIRLYDRPAKVKETMEELKAEMKNIFKDKYEQVALEYFDFETWIDSKIERKEYATLKKERLAKQA